MPLSDEELNGLIAKLKERYAEYAKRNPTWFNRDAFEERLLMAIRNRMNMEAFILAEIANFEKVREKYEKEKSKRPFSETVDRIIEEQTARIKKYPAIRFHSKAGIEISHFYGALSEFALHYLPILYVLLPSGGLKDILISFDDRLKDLAVPRGTLPARRVENHVSKIRLGATELELERDKNEYLKESAFLLHEIIDFCDELVESRDPSFETPLRMNRLTIEEGRRNIISSLFAGCTGYGAIIKVRERAEAIIADFRLTAFKRRREA